MDQLLKSPYLIWVVLLLVVLLTALAYLLSRNGWKLKNIKSFKIGPVEGTRFDKTGEDQPGGSTYQDIEVNVKKNTFQGDTGDIGGVIIKQKYGKDKK